MNDLYLLRITVGGWWLALGLWLGAMVMLALTAAATFRAVRDLEPTITVAGYPAFDDAASPRHGDIIAGAAVGRSLRSLSMLQRLCAFVAVACLVVQTSVLGHHLAGGAWGWPNVLRMILLALPVMILVGDIYVVSPRVWSLRERMLDPAASVEQRAAARGEFQIAHKLNENLHKAATLLLLGAAIVSAVALHPGRPADAASIDRTPAAQHAPVDERLP
jgi:hypothetical protein